MRDPWGRQSRLRLAQHECLRNAEIEQALCAACGGKIDYRFTNAAGTLSARLALRRFTAVAVRPTGITGENAKSFPSELPARPRSWKPGRAGRSAVISPVPWHG